jgi:hypothetical protein
VSVLWSRPVALIVVRASGIEEFEWLNQGVNHSFVELCGMVTGQTRRFFVMLYKILQHFRKIIFKKSQILACLGPLQHMCTITFLTFMLINHLIWAVRH